MFPIVDYGVPKEREAYRRLILQVVDSLRAGTNVLAHCGAGIGRTGTLAACVLVVLGVPVAEALETVHAAGSYPERPEQLDLVELGGAQHRRGLCQLTVTRQELPPGWVAYNPAISSITSRPIISSGSISCTLGMLMMYC